jgi:PHP domain-containing protein
MNKTGIQKFVFVVPILCIVLLAALFPFQIYFEDALTLEPVMDYGLKISVWRIVFEPVLGPLLFFNRSIYALRELPLALLWILAFYFIFGWFEIFRGRVDRKRMVLNKMANLPLLIGICFAIFVLILFVPLPNNTIVNNSRDGVLVTTHAHTEFSHDGLTSQENMWKWHRRNGFDAFFITDHAHYRKSLEFAQKQKQGKFPAAPLILVGQEHSGSNHMSLLGLNGKFETKGMSDKAIIDTVHHYGGAVIINHWFDGKGKEKELYKKLGADGFEIENAGKDLYYNREIFGELKKFCWDNHLTMVGGLDFHGYGRVCSLYNAFEIPKWHTLDHASKQQKILSILKNGPQEKIKVLVYKDRPFYSDSHLWIRPFWTVIQYFRTLNVFQVLSWVFWLSLFQCIWNWKKGIVIRNDITLLILAGGSALFMIVLAFVYSIRGERVKGYSEVYAEYSSLLAPIGCVFLLYVLIISYFRFFKQKKAIHPS